MPVPKHFPRNSMPFPFGLLTIDLDAVRRNWTSLRDSLAVGAECGAVVKADAYGLGMVPVARALREAGCGSFFVVNLDEARALRKALGDAPTIYVLQGPSAGSEAECVAHRLVPVLISVAMVQRWLVFCETESVPLAQRHVAIKINTGMNRLGLDLSELHALLSEPTDFARLGCGLLISHLACADEPGHPLNQRQRLKFVDALKRVRQQQPTIQGSLANSAAALQGKDWHFDLVRPGICLYGSNPLGTAAPQMTPVATLELPVVQQRQVSAGEAVGYGATYVAQADRHLVALAGGYGDGLFRSLGNRGEAWCGRRLPIVGRVSMDSIIVDVTELSPNQRPQEGDLLELLGRHIDVDSAARAAGTIAYEILTHLKGRYMRRYLLDGQANLVGHPSDDT